MTLVMNSRYGMVGSFKALLGSKTPGPLRRTWYFISLDQNPFITLKGGVQHYDGYVGGMAKNPGNLSG